MNQQLIQEEIYLNQEIPVTVAKQLAVFVRQLYMRLDRYVDSAEFLQHIMESINNSIKSYDATKGVMYEYVKRGILYDQRTRYKREENKPDLPLDYQDYKIEEFLTEEHTYTDDEIIEIYIAMHK